VWRKSILGRKPGHSGNLMAPPMEEVCIEVEPESATVTVNGMPVADGTCTTVLKYRSVSISAWAEGYEGYQADVQVDTKITHVIQMVANSVDSKSTEESK
jgi:hypothetical protein